MDAQTVVAWYSIADTPAERIDAAWNVLEYVLDGDPMDLTVVQQTTLQRRILELLDVKLLRASSSEHPV